MASRMRFVCCAIALACAAMAATATASTTHLVGGDAGWKIPNEVKFYATWAADKTFNVGDKLGKKSGILVFLLPVLQQLKLPFELYGSKKLEFMK